MAQHPAHAQNHRHPDEPRPDDVERALKGVEFPANKEHVLRVAKQNGADGEVIAILEKINDHHFDSTAAILREVTRTE
ncbi:hypothetical protein AWB64_04333 [Caballeronia sordidicola]|uniref:DUF2795 domain-containing protein n=1 Tax=Caballeronia sordidicola TaxID=196367 RepID=A0A158HAR4_CABSO|nr:DUF2795 domain-containing protein [Caballeronia sordidicola]SAL40830.1 hypothetical protein AWB64_04333 [Caballeronia sordidicola]